MNEDQLFNSTDGGDTSKDNFKSSQLFNKGGEEVKNQDYAHENPNMSRTVNYNTNYNTNYNKGPKKSGCFWAAIVGAAIIVGFIGISVFSIASMALGGFSDHEVASHGEYVETIKIEGTITSDNATSYGVPIGYQHSWTLNSIKNMIEDENNKGIILYINSGGGGVYESDELYLTLKDYKEKTGRPIYAYYAQSAASGALYVSMAADEIYANRMTTTGSIGVRMTSYNAKEFMDKLGIKEITVASGENKNMLSPTSETTDEHIQIVKDMIDESYDVFVKIISDERGIPLDNVKEMADGRIYTSSQALELNLIDAISTYDDFMGYIMDKPEFINCEFTEGYYPTNSFLSRFLSSIPERPKTQLDLLTDVLEKSESYQLNY